MELLAAVFIASAFAAMAQDLTPADDLVNVLDVYHSEDWLSWAEKMPIDASLELDQIPLPAAPVAVRSATWQAPTPQPAQYLFSVRFNAVTTITLGRRKNATLVNVRACNTDSSRSILLPQEQILMTATDLNMLTATQATWLLTQKRGKQWSVMAERYGTLGLALGAAFAGQPYVAAAIPLVQQLVAFFKTQEPDVAPFLQEMLPLEIPLSAAGQKGDCVTGSLFAAKKGNVL